MQDPYSPPTPSPNPDAILENPNPLPDTDFNTLESSPYFKVLKNLQGNILKGHGRDHSANIFLQFSEKDNVRFQIKYLTATYVTTALKQLEESNQYKRFKIPGSLFGNLFLTASLYRKLGFENDIDNWFGDKDNIPPGAEDIFPQSDSFLKGMRAVGEDLGDLPKESDFHTLVEAGLDQLTPIQQYHLHQRGRTSEAPLLEPLEKAYMEGTIDAMLLLADDDEGYLHRVTRTLITKLEKSGVVVLAVELGDTLRNDEGEGIEHFGYVDGRSQPLFLASDFKNLQNGAIDPHTTTEKINEKAQRRESGAIDIWNPFESLSAVLTRDNASSNPMAYGSFFVFRKLEQDVLRFSIAEQQLADKLKLEGTARERAGAMAVGRFRDGTPLVESETDGLIPSKSNNFRYDGLDAGLKETRDSPNDRLGLKCPFQAHIRKTSPRQSVNNLEDAGNLEAIRFAEKTDRGRRITRRGIPYGNRVKHPNAFQTLDDLPTGRVGLLFASFQNSIVRRFAFMQKAWANNASFKVPFAGIDPVIGHPLSPVESSHPPQNWRKEYDGSPGQPVPENLPQLDLFKSHTTKFSFEGFVKFRGGEFFFAPSIPFLLELTTKPKSANITK